MLNWCRHIDTYLKNIPQYDKACCNWMCKCGIRYGKHWIEGRNNELLSCPKTKKKMFFRFKHNDYCTLECQMLYLLSKNQKMEKEK